MLYFPASETAAELCSSAWKEAKQQQKHMKLVKKLADVGGDLRHATSPQAPSTWMLKGSQVRICFMGWDVPMFILNRIRCSLYSSFGGALWHPQLQECCQNAEWVFFSGELCLSSSVAASAPLGLALP